MLDRARIKGLPATPPDRECCLCLPDGFQVADATVLEIGGRPMFWSPSLGILVTLEGICSKKSLDACCAEAGRP